MKNNQTCPGQSVVLVSTPWPLFNRPSVQLGVLKAYLKSRFPDLKVDAHHFYLKVAETIGYKLYQTISERTWLAETIYASLLFPERLEHIKKLFYREAAGKPLLRKVDFKDLAAQVREVSENFINSIDWSACMLAGFSVCLCQLTSALYLMRQIRQKFPNLTIVTGGSMFAGDSAHKMFQVFPEIDIVVSGEGELPLGHLISLLKDSKTCEDITPVPGIMTRKIPGNSHPDSFWQIKDLTDIPHPDFDEYFNLLKTFSPQKTFFPTLPVEMSRGCWWRCARKTPESANSDSESLVPDSLTGCAFCNLNLQWDGYRSKDPSQVVTEIDTLTAKHKVLSIAVMDNAPPVKTSEEIFSRLGDLDKDFRLFCEIRASTPERVLRTMRTAGMKEVQIGIEALSTSLLRKLNKGTTAIQNLEIMKHCEALGIVNRSNLILCFPGSDSQDVEETLQSLEFAMPFNPLKFVRFWLGLESPVWKHPGAFGIRAVFNHPNYAALFPQEIYGSMRFMIQAYRGDMVRQRKLWLPVKKKIRAWEKAYEELCNRRSGSPILSFRDARDFLIIRQKRLKQEPFTHRLVGISRDIYLFCQTRRSVKRIVDHFPQAGEEKIVPFLKMMADKKLMFGEDGKYLSLAVRSEKFNY